MIPDSASPSVRRACQAGRFYEADENRLRAEVKRLLENAEAAPRAANAVALLAPHAGYIYSGHVAAEAYRQIVGRAVDHVLLLGPSHYFDFTGAALPPSTAFATPLGEVALDREAIDELAARPGFLMLEEAHDTEHALEVQLPFLQVALERPFTLVPVSLGRMASGAGLNRLTEPLLDLLRRRTAQGESWLIVASSDTYHGYHPEACEANDRRLSSLIECLDSDEIRAAASDRSVMACGWLALVLAMDLARGLGAGQGVVLKRSNSRGGSGGVPGEYIVGYIAAAFV